jgi:hypothetical protein
MKYICTIILLAIIRTSYAQPAGYAFYKQVIIDATEVSGASALTNFPVLISITDTDLRSTPNGGNVENTNGFDIIFTLGDCATMLSHDLEYYNPVTGELVIWVQVPTLSNSVNTPFFMFYSNSAVVTDQSTTDIWTDTGYDGVWHLHNDFADASGNGNTGTNNGSTNISPANNSADGQSFVDPNHWIELASHPARTGDFSYSGWARTVDNTKSGQRIICDDAGNTSGCHAISIGDPGTGRIRFYIRGMAPTILDSPVGTITSNTWHFVAATFNGTTNLASLYVDGVVVNSVTYTGTIGPAAGNASIGGEVASGEAGNRFDGDLDEIRSNNSLLSSDWLLTEYNNQNSPSTFYTLSSELTATALCVTLPVELLYFNATLVESKYVKLDWQTASEINNDYFEIERSTNGIDWENIGQVQGAGNSSSIINYETVDFNTHSGISYYRLKQTDFDGQFEYSQIRSVNIERLKNAQTEIYPNPATNKITIIGSAAELEEIVLYNTLGQDVTTLTKQSIESGGQLIIDLSKLSSGIYYVKTKTTANKVYKK